MRVATAPVAVVVGVGFVAVAWVGNWVMDGYWPGTTRLWLGTAIGIAGILWGASGFQNLLKAGGTQLRVGAGQAAAVVATLILGTLGLVLFYNW